MIALEYDATPTAIRATNRNCEHVMDVGGAIVAEWGSALCAIGSAYLSGPVYIDGDLIVDGTIYCDSVKPLTDRQRAEVHNRAAAQRRRSGD